jgi:hypothetical protein
LNTIYNFETASNKETSVDKKEFRIFPAERMYVEFPWQIWAVGWLAIFKAVIWLAYDPNLPDSVLRLLAYKYALGMLPLIICGIGVWNLRRWAVWGVIAIAIASLAFLLITPQTFSGLLIKSEVFLYSVVLTAIVMVGSGPLGDIFILIAAPTILKLTKPAKD